MKYHLNIIFIALRILITAAAVMALLNIFIAVKFLQSDDPELETQVLADFFDFPSKNFSGNILYSTGFAVLYALLTIYVITGLVKFYKCLLKIEKGYMFDTNQGENFRKAGAIIIIFAKLKYLLFCIMSIISYFDITQFFRQIPSFLTVYLIGKFILLYSYITEKGEVIKHENDLTI